MSEFFIKRGGKIHGPFSESQIRAGLKSKKLSSEDLISQNRSGPWETVQSKSPMFAHSRACELLDEGSAWSAALRLNRLAMQEASDVVFNGV